jgi:hypothetical protein
MKRRIAYEGFAFNRFVPRIEHFFEGIAGIRIERISEDFIEVRIKRHFPVKKFNSLQMELISELKEIGNGKRVQS